MKWNRSYPGTSQRCYKVGHAILPNLVRSNVCHLLSAYWETFTIIPNMHTRTLCIYYLMVFLQLQYSSLHDHEISQCTCNMVHQCKVFSSMCSYCIIPTFLFLSPALFLPLFLYLSSTSSFFISTMRPASSQSVSSIIVTLLSSLLLSRSLSHIFFLTLIIWFPSAFKGLGTFKS